MIILQVLAGKFRIPKTVHGNSSCFGRGIQKIPQKTLHEILEKCFSQEMHYNIFLCKHIFCAHKKVSHMMEI